MVVRVVDRGRHDLVRVAARAAGCQTARRVHARILDSMRTTRRAVLGLVLSPVALAAAGCGDARGTTGPLVVFAASSLADVLEACAGEYSAAGGVAIRFNFAGSNVLARQLRQGAVADVFVSADEAQMRLLTAEDVVRRDSVAPLLWNSLAIVVRRDWAGRIASVPDLANPDLRRIAIGDPAAVPAGVYARQLLERHRLWDRLQPRLVPSLNVRAALATVDAGHADAAIVYVTDVAAGRQVRLAYAVPPREGPAVIYPAGVLVRSRRPEAAAAFLAWLRQPAAVATFERFGFTATAPAP